MTFVAAHFTRFSNTIHYWEYDESGSKKHLTVPAPLYFYLKDEKGTHKSIYGDTLKKIEFDKYDKFREAREMYKAAGRHLFESDVDIEQRFIIDNYKNKEMTNKFLDVHFIDIEVHSEVGFPDVTEAGHPITIITVYSRKHKKYFVFSEKDFDRKFLPEGSVVVIKENEVELLKTFIAFIKKAKPDIISGWNSDGFDIPYIVNRCFKLLGEDITRQLSPINQVRKVFQKLNFGKSREIYDIAGINSIDYLALYRKYHQGEQESFKLDYICKVEIGKQKLKYEGTLKELYRNNWQMYVEYNVQDVALIKELDERLGFMDMMIGICYNCRTPFQLFGKTTKVLDGAFISRLVLEDIILPDVTYDSDDESDDQYEGAYVKPPIVGKYDWVMSFDATSLYPSIMMQHNISPETKVKVVNQTAIDVILDCLEGKEVDENLLKNIAYPGQTCKDVVDEIRANKYTMASNGVIYRHDKDGIVAKFVKEWFDKRVFHKKLMEKAKKENNDDETQLQKGLQQNYKILINSVYGYVGSKYSRMFDRDNAEAVTITGKHVLTTTMDTLDGFFKNKWAVTEIGKKLKATSVPTGIVVAGDTDSVYCNVGAILKSFNYPLFNDNAKCCEFLEKNIEPLLFKIIDGAMQVFTKKRMNCTDCKVSFKREMIARRIIFLAKKRYVGWVMKMETKLIPEGDEHEIEAKGIEMIRSSTPEKIRQYMRQFLTKMLKSDSKDESNKMLREIYDQYRLLDLDVIAKIINVKGIQEYTGTDGEPIKGTPNHVKASIRYNNLLERRGLGKEYEKIYNGDKIKVIDMKESPNFPYTEIAFKDKLPEKFNISKFVDYDSMWEASFMKPMRVVYEIIKWETPNFEQVNIEDLFS